VAVSAVALVAAASVAVDSVDSAAVADSAAAAAVRVGKPFCIHDHTGSMMAKNRITLDEFVEQLRALHGSRLRTVVLYGSAATDEQVEGLSDLNVLVLVDSIAVETLRMLGPTVHAWVEAGNPPPLTLRVDEWQRSADIFPMEYADILERHRVLFGSAPFADVTVNSRDLRLQLEHEAMGKLLRLRQGVMAAGASVAQQRDLMRASFSTLMVIFRAAERLAGQVPPRDKVALIREVAMRGEFDPVAFERVAGLVRGATISDADTPSVLSAYVQAMETLVEHLDGFNPPGLRGGSLST
jgi:hypothetical protein